MRAPFPVRPRALPAPARRQLGQAMTEMVIALLLVLIPLFVFAWAINSYGTSRNLALSAARYAAWERTVWFESAPTDSPLTGQLRVQKPQATVQQEMLDRVFVRHTGNAPAIRSTLPQQAPRNSDLVSYTEGHDGRDRVELERLNGQNEQGSRPALRLADTGTRTSTGVADALNQLSAVTSPLSGSPRIDLESRGIWQAQVQLRPNALNVSAVSNGRQQYLPFVTFTETAAAMGDPWNVGGWQHEERRVKPLVPSNIFDNSVLNTIRNIVGSIVTPLDSSNLKPGYVDADRLPPDRRR